MSSPLTTARLARRAESIETREDLNRWSIRSRTRLRFLLIAYLIGALPLIIVVLYLNIRSAITGDTISLNGLVFASFSGFCCFGPMVLLPCFVLLSSGLSNYRRTISELRHQNRVCEVCGVVALFEDQYVKQSQAKGHARADLVPSMRVFEEDGQTHVLCDKCFAAVAAVDGAQKPRRYASQAKSDRWIPSHRRSVASRLLCAALS